MRTLDCFDGLIRQSVQQGLATHSADWMTPQWCYVQQRAKDKRAFVRARMGQDRIWLRAHQAMHVDDIEVERASRIWHATHTPLYCLYSM